MSLPRTTQFDADLADGYRDGRALDSPEPGPNRSRAYCHGFRNGRDDAECAQTLRLFPSRTAEQARRDLYAIAMLEGDAPQEEVR